MSKKNHTWERLPQVKEIMENNKPIWIRDTRPANMWEQCVNDYFERDKQEWERRKK